MSILLTKAQKVAGFDCPNGTLVIGLDKEVEALAAQGGGALPLDIGVVSGAGISVKGARLVSGSVAATAGSAAGTTWAVTMALPVPFTHIAPIFLNVETGAIAIGGCCAAAVASYTGFPHSASAFTPLTFDGGNAAGSMPARAAASQPTPYIGDMVPLQSVPSIDGSGMYYVHVRTYFAGTGYSYIGSNGTTESGAALFGGQTYRTTSQAVDGVTTPANFTNGSAGNNMVLAGLAYYSEVGGACVAFIGDSTVRGVGSTSDLASGGVRAVGALSKPAMPYVAANMGCAGATPAVYEANAERYLAVMGATRAFYRVSSINQPVTTQAIADAHFALMVRAHQFCQARNIKFYPETCTPQNLGSVGADAFRTALNARVIAYAMNNGLKCVDVAAAVQDPAAPWRYLPAFNSGDNSHPNDAGYAAIQAAEQAVLASP